MGHYYMLGNGEKTSRWVVLGACAAAAASGGCTTTSTDAAGIINDYLKWQQTKACLDPQTKLWRNVAQGETPGITCEKPSYPPSLSQSGSSPAGSHYTPPV